jgi:hypothetical protein
MFTYFDYDTWGGTADSYFQADKDDPQQKHEFVDLRKNPGDVDKLPEVKRTPELRRVLLTINGDKSIFKTYSCDFKAEDADHPDPCCQRFIQDKSNHRARCWVYVGFADVARCANPDDYILLHGRLAWWLRQSIVVTPSISFAFPIWVDFQIADLDISGKYVGKVAQLSMYCDAPTATDARSECVKLVNFVAEYLANEKLHPGLANYSGWLGRPPEAEPHP